MLPLVSPVTISVAREIEGLKEILSRYGVIAPAIRGYARLESIIREI